MNSLFDLAIVFDRRIIITSLIHKFICASLTLLGVTIMTTFGPKFGQSCSKELDTSIVDFFINKEIISEMGGFKLGSSLLSDM